MARLTAATYATYLFGMVTGPLAARAIGPQGRGQAAVVLAFVPLATALLSMSIGPAIGNVLTNRKATEEQALGAALRFSIYMVLPSAALAVGFYWGHPTQSLGSSVRAAGAVLILLAPLVPIAQAFEYILLSRGDLTRIARVRLRSFVAFSATIVVLFALGDLTTATFVGVLMVQGIVALLMFATSTRVRPTSGLPVGPLVGYGIRQLGGSVMAFANVRADQLLLAPLVGFRDLGIYAVAVTLALVPLGLAASVTARALSTAGTADSFRSDNAALALRTVVLLTAAACALLAIAAPIVIPWAYGTQFRGASVVLLLLLPGTLAIAGSAMAAQHLTVLGRPGTLTLAELASLIVNGLLLWILVPRYGIRGAAVASSLAYGLRFALLFPTLRNAGIAARSVIPRRADVAMLIGRLAHH